MPRHRKPLELKAVQGTLRGDRDPDPASVPKPAPPPSLAAPEWLDEKAAVKWDELAPELTRLGLLTVIELPALAALCCAHSRLELAEAEIRERGVLVSAKTRDGALVVKRNPATSVAREATAAIASLGALLGVGAVARADITKKRGATEEPEDDFERYLRGRER